MKNIIIMLIITHLVSCIGPEPEEQIFKYKIIIKNQYVTTIGVKPYDIPFDTILIKSNNIYEVSRETETPPYSFYCDTIKILYFDRSKMYSSYDTSSRNPLRIENYIATEISKGYFEYSYTITEQDYLDADPIK